MSYAQSAAMPALNKESMPPRKAIGCGKATPCRELSHRESPVQKYAEKLYNICRVSRVPWECQSSAGKASVSTGTRGRQMMQAYEYSHAKSEVRSVFGMV